ncbi:putative transporter small subunit [Streptomyces verrucosisporus]|nr:putative transporter small subunit [Streptomyces verrucosisporus]
MSTIALSTYILIWPVIVAVVLFVVGRAFYCEWAEARRDGRSLI